MSHGQVAPFIGTRKLKFIPNYYATCPFLTRCTGKSILHLNIQSTKGNTIERGRDELQLSVHLTVSLSIDSPRCYVYE